MTDHARNDPLGVEADHEKAEGRPKEGPPVAKMATTYGSSFVTDEDQADAIAADESDEGVGAHAGLGDHGHPGGSTESMPSGPGPRPD